MILSIFGRNFSGKSTLAGLVAERHGFTRVSFADPLRKLVEDLFGITARWKVDEPWRVDTDYLTALNRLSDTVPSLQWSKIWERVREIRTKKEAYRTTMELVGTEIARDTLFGGTWTGVATYEILALVAAEKKVVIDDMRFRDEYHLLKRFGARMIRVYSEREERNNGHRSQGYIDDFEPDMSIWNNGTIDELWTKYKEIK